MASSSIHISISNTNLSKITRPDLSAIRMTATSTKVILPSQSISRSSNLRLPSSSSPLRCTSILDHVRMAPEPPNKPRKDPLRIAIIGFGNFGQFIARGLARQGHNVLATSRTDYSQYCNRHGIQFFRSLDAMCEEQPDIVLVCTSILSTEGVIRRIPLHKLKPDTIFADVLSVKQYPRNLFVEVLPPEFGIVCTHPMFGPESGRHGWVGLPFVYDQVRVRPHSLQARKCARFLNIFEKEGCRMVHMSCEEHDRYAAGSQFITHTIGRILSHLNLESTPINTKGYETLLNLTENTVSDSTDLYFGLFMYNVNATEQIANLDRAFETVKQKLFGKLHDILREQIVERIPMPGTPTRVMDPHFLRDANRMEGLTSLIVPRRSEHVKRMEDIRQQPSPLRSPSLR